MAVDTKTVLLEVAEDVVRRRGFDAFSYADLADAVGIRKASIHYHFPTKAALSCALVERYHAELKAKCAAIAEIHATAQARLEALIGVYREALEDGQKVCLCVALVSSRESLSAETRLRISKFRGMMLDWLRDCFELALSDHSVPYVGDPSDEAYATLAMLEGAHLAARAVEDVDQFDRAVAILERRLGKKDPSST